VAHSATGERFLQRVTVCAVICRLNLIKKSFLPAGGHKSRISSVCIESLDNSIAGPIRLVTQLRWTL
jgi:hypothetical protein